MTSATGAAGAVADGRLRRIIDSLADAVLVVDTDGIVKFANPAAEKLFGRSREEVVGDHFGLPLVAGETTEVDLTGGRVAEMRTVELEWEGHAAWLASLRDISSRREAERTERELWREKTAREEAEKQRHRLEGVLERAPAAVLVTFGPEHRCVFANPRMRQLLDGPPSRYLADLSDRIEGEHFFEGFRTTFEQGVGRASSELRVRVADRSGVAVPRTLDVTWEPLSYNGGLEGVVCFVDDVTGQVETRESLRSAMDRLREEERRKDQFLAVLGHELRNPLAGISSGLALVEEGVPPDRRAWALQMMQRQVAAIGGLLDDLLDVSAIAQGKLELQSAAIRLADPIEAAVAALRPRFEEKRQHLVLEGLEEPVSVRGDLRRLQQVVGNLLGNASKYSEEGTEVRLRLRRRGESVSIEVEDRGQGIPAAMLDEIFEPFIQGAPEGGRVAEGGLGIGLTLVRQLVELHGGRVAASSEGPGKGSLFRVELPVGAPAEPSGEEVRVKPSPPAGVRRVLVVDDDEDSAQALGELLALDGFATATAGTGAEALERIADWRPDVVLLDLDLPDFSGFEVAERVRERGDTPAPLLVALSGFGQERTRERAAQAGIDHHLLKPVDHPRLLALLASAAHRT